MGFYFCLPAGGSLINQNKNRNSRGEERMASKGKKMQIGLCVAK
ncbi:hypothetical protein C900_01258 [Fulvivirga imtechensis AK7]|uniref:Uncharacterized protein n=1 Tax=Fulvivirga imtechensis AK7 TaxID=1237149 RepID=L8JIE1_9BACT|nr:hypothetical protein C900_01258 [Fulvivirga imtechensis AK7]